MEVCIDNIESALNAVAGGASRIELCSALSEGGLTPSLGLFIEIRRLIVIPIFVMIRPRRGMDCVYSNEELNSMELDVVEFKKAGANGFVFGVLNKDRTVNSAACSRLRRLCEPSPVTFHRAFDFVKEPFECLNNIIDLKFERILTSGQASTAFIGKELIKHLIQTARGRIMIVPGAGVNVNNAYEILKFTGASEIHGSAKRNKKLYFQDILNSNLSLTEIDSTLAITDTENVRKIVSIVNQINSERREFI